MNFLATSVPTSLHYLLLIIGGAVILLLYIAFKEMFKGWRKVKSVRDQVRERERRLVSAVGITPAAGLDLHTSQVSPPPLPPPLPSRAAQGPSAPPPLPPRIPGRRFSGTPRRSIFRQILEVFRSSFGTSDDFMVRPQVLAPLVRKEMRTMLRSPRSVWLMATMTAAMSLFFLVFWHKFALTATLTTRAQLSRILFSTLFIVQYIGLGLISALMTSTVVSSERENKTLDLLYCTGFSRMEILVTKWISTILYQLILFVALLPIMALTFQLGGVDLTDYLSAALLIIAGIGAYGMVGLAFSSHMRRTIHALMASVGVTFLLWFFVPAYGFFGFWGRGGWDAMGQNSEVTTLFLFLIFLAVSFFMAANFAWAGLAQKDSNPSQKATKVIKDKKILEQRRKTWPFYLIDPLARNQNIKDGKNPVYIKEQRAGGMARLDILLRLGYVAIFFSFVLSVIRGFNGDFGAVRFFAKWMTAMIALFIPALAATGLSREQEEGTLDLLKCSLLSMRRIVWAKVAIPVRFLTVLISCSLIFPVILQTSMSASHASYQSVGTVWFVWESFAKVVPMMVAFCFLYSAVGIFASSLCKRNISAIVSSYIAMFTLMLAPFITAMIRDLLFTSPNSAAQGLRWISDFILFLQGSIGPLVSPYYYFAESANQAGAGNLGEGASWPFILRDFLIIFAVSVALIEAAVRIIDHKSKG